MARINDLLRTALRIRVKRRLDPPGPPPEPGSRVIFNGVRMKIDGPLSDDTWQWMVLHGWRECRFRKDRRRYIDLPRGAFAKLRGARPNQREKVQRRILDYVERRRAECVSLG